MFRLSFKSDAFRRSTTGFATLVVAALVLSACGGDTEALTAVPAQEDAVAARTPNLSAVSLIMSVRDAAGDRIRSDGGGAYVDGSQTVTARFDAFGNILVSVVSATTPARRLVYDYAAPVNATSSFRGIGAQRWFKILSNKTNNNNPAIQSMVVGDARCYNVTFAEGDGTQQVRHWFNPAANAASTYARITRTDATHWVMTSEGCGTNTDRAAVDLEVKSNKTTAWVAQGIYALPFSIAFAAR